MREKGESISAGCLSNFFLCDDAYVSLKAEPSFPRSVVHKKVVHIDGPVG